jgi:hypothetical protein
MKKLLTIGLLALLATSCGKRFNADYESRLAGVKKVCPNCTFHSYGVNGITYYAIDTSKQPNYVYIVDFCDGVVYSTSTVDHLVKIN